MLEFPSGIVHLEGAKSVPLILTYIVSFFVSFNCIPTYRKRNINNIECCVIKYLLLLGKFILQSEVLLDSAVLRRVSI